MQKIFKKR